MRSIRLLAVALLLGGCVPADTAEPRAAVPARANAATQDDVAVRSGSTAPTVRPATASGATSPTDAPRRPAATAQPYAHNDPGGAGASLPPAIIRALETDELVLTCREGTREGTSRFAAEWVGVRRFDLDDDGRPDWIVNGRHACLRTSYGAYWWVFADGEAGPPGVLRGESGASLEILPTSTRGFRDLRMHIVNGRGAELVADSRYDGETYTAAPAP